jgi:hypothetical protein
MAAPTATPSPLGGPRTPEGKARSAQNALRHGLRAGRFALLPEEDAEEFKALVAELRRVHAPEGPIELLQVDAVAVAIWRELRADRLEAEALADIAPAEPGRSCGSDLAEPGRRAGLATILRYRAQAQAEHRRALQLLAEHRRLRAARPAAVAAPEPDAAAAAAPDAPAAAGTDEPPPPPEPARVAPRARARQELASRQRIRLEAEALARLDPGFQEAPERARRPAEDPLDAARRLLDDWLQGHPADGRAA